MKKKFFLNIAVVFFVNVVVVAFRFVRVIYVLVSLSGSSLFVCLGYGRHGCFVYVFDVVIIIIIRQEVLTLHGSESRE